MNTGGATVNRGEIVSMYAGLYSHTRNEVNNKLNLVQSINQLCMFINRLYLQLKASRAPGEIAVNCKSGAKRHFPAVTK